MRQFLRQPGVWREPRGTASSPRDYAGVSLLPLSVGKPQYVVRQERDLFVEG